MKNDANFTWKIKFRFAMTETAFNKEKAVFTSKLDLNFRKKLIKCYIWNVIDTVGTVYHLVMYMQANKIHKVF